MGILLLAIVLALGFTFTSCHYPSRFRQQRTDGWNAYFHAAAWGSFFVVLALPILLYLDYINIARYAAHYLGLSYQKIKEWPVDYIQLKIIAWGSISFAMVGCFSLVSSFIYSDRDRKLAKTLTLVKDDQFEYLLYDAMNRRLKDPTSPLFLSVTLKSRKVYVGQVNDLSVDHGEIESFSLVPMLSGYRKSEDLDIVFLTNYQSHYESYQDELGMFRIVVRKDEVDVIAFFNIQSYVKFKASKALPITDKYRRSPK